MGTQKHPDFQEEDKYLQSTCQCLEDEINYLKIEVKEVEEELQKLKKSVGGSYSDELIFKTTIHDGNIRKLKMLVRAEEKPYFGRIDFKELMKDEFESFYIGKASLMRRFDEKRLVIDWRAPIASLYYSGDIGEVMYKAPGGLIMGDLNVKRQYDINKKKLINVFDKGVTPMDEYLQDALWEKKDNRLRDIVTTIQSEQNNIIRAHEDKVLVVQGVAGSGKTTIVLHRIAYLMYTYQEMFQADKLLIVVPNKLFLNYISDVLPDLGVEEIKQSTFEDLAMELLDKEYALIDTEDKLLKLLDYKNYPLEFREKLQNLSSFKGSMMFKNMLDSYIDFISSEILTRENLTINNYQIFTYKEIIEMFSKDFSYLPIVPRVERIRKYVESNIKNRLKEIQSTIIKEYDGKVKSLKKKVKDEEELQKQLINIYDERDQRCNELDKNLLSSINKYFKSWSSLIIEDIYKNFMCDVKLLKEYGGRYLDSEAIEFISQYSKEIFDKGLIEREDLSPLLYIHIKLIGTSLKGRFNHIVIDEAQDYSHLQFYILKQLSSNNSFTIVGDLSQGIHSYRGIQRWDEMINNVFDDKYEYLTLKKCYRSTMEIMNFANKVIEKWRGKDVTLAEPVLRSGDKPIVIKNKDKKDMIGNISQMISNLIKENFKSIAIICKNTDEGLEVYESIKNTRTEDIHLITDKDTLYTGGIVIIPSYLAKGLEFDAVIVYNCSRDNYINDELHIKLLYVALTRPLHKLFIYYFGEQSELIENIKDECHRIG